MPKASDVLAMELRRRILEDGLAAGHRLPSEAELIEEFGLSRTTVREALRLLEVEGLITIRRGPKGGVVVQMPQDERVMNALGVLLQSRRVPLSELLEAREIIEPPCSALAARRATTQDVAMLAATTERMERSEPGSREYHAANTAFHVGLGEAAHSEVLKILLASTRHLYEISTARMRFDERQTRWGVKAHLRIIEAIRDRDPERAREATLKHVRTFSKWLARADVDDESVSITASASR